MGFRQEYGALLEEIVQEADAIAMRYFRAAEMRVARKADGTAITPADQEVEEMARAKVAARGLALSVLGEEMGGSDVAAPDTSGRARLIIDPIDGTEEFSRGIPTFGTLLGIERNGEIVAGMVSAPALRAQWCAYRGEGAYRDGKRIHVSDISQLKEAMVFTGGTGPSKIQEKYKKARRLLDASKHGRSMGGFWEHMLVAEGAIEAALDLRSKPWDLAPLGIIVEEAGGRATNMRGERTIYSGDFVSSNGKVHEEVLKLLR
ncbi:MAG TPA: inositol monophosphatase family protein [Candidatus Dormibacteraeota bacterium]|nr:inositol monophosphatase family protein [Candidatus Dormibacteraeota bacterium]